MLHWLSDHIANKVLPSSGFSDKCRYSDTLGGVFKKLLLCQGCVSVVLLLRAAPLGISSLLKGGRWAERRLSTGRLVCILLATDSPNLAEAYQARPWGTADIAELAWEILWWMLSFLSIDTLWILKISWTVICSKHAQSPRL